MNGNKEIEQPLKKARSRGSALNDLLGCCASKLYIEEFIMNESCELDFGHALKVLKKGGKVARKGWNGKGIFIELQKPDANSKMSSPYIYIDTTGLDTDNPDAPRSLVPWIASQTDMLCEDWVIL